MQHVAKVINDIFSMGFDVVIPVSGVIIAVLVAILMFLLRYYSFRRNSKKFAGKSKYPPLVREPRKPRVPQKEDDAFCAAEVCDETIYAFLLGAIEKRTSCGDTLDGSFGDAMSAELAERAPEVSE